MQALQTRIATITAGQQAAVIELMAPAENPFGRPSIIMPYSLEPQGLLISPAEPVDEPGDDD